MPIWCEFFLAIGAGFLPTTIRAVANTLHGDGKDGHYHGEDRYDHGHDFHMK